LEVRGRKGQEVGENCTMGSAEDNVWRLEGGSDRRLEKTAQWGASRLLLFTKYYYGEEVKQFVMGGPYSMLGGYERCT
jgi:hypothetical protein